MEVTYTFVIEVCNIRHILEGSNNLKRVFFQISADSSI